jgi:2-haloalkanoic acid dehalogenase type II
MLTRRPTAVAFDCYGTLIDVTDESFIRACAAILRRHGLAHDSRAFWETWLASSRALAKEQGRDPEDPLAGPEPEFHPFRLRWPHTFARAFAETGVSVDAVAAYEAFHDTLSSGIAYPDARPALDRLRRHFRLVVVSNADDDHLHHALAENGLAFEFILSSETARSYKPRPRIFQRACELLGLPPEQVLYVGDSPMMDVLGARNAGMSVAWLNRRGAPRPDKVPPPDIEVADLMALADILLESPRQA